MLVAAAATLLLFSAWAFVFNTKLTICGSKTTDHIHLAECVAANANAYERRNWLAGVLAVCGFASVGIVLAHRLRANLSSGSGSQAADEPAEE
jgi:hypothetical protein